MKKLYTFVIATAVAMFTISDSATTIAQEDVAAPLVNIDSTLVDQYYVYETFPNTTGTEFSSLLGYGIFYKRALSSNVQVKVSGLPYYYENNNEMSQLFNIGAQMQLDFIKLRELRGYGLAGGSYTTGGSRNKQTNWEYDQSLREMISSDTVVTSHREGFSFAVGLGVETRLFHRLICHAEILGGYNNVSKSGRDSSFEKSLTAGFGFGLGIVF